jgi:pSer/pThr/pTyr-binding forkhead associated (FHA) protein
MPFKTIGRDDNCDLVIDHPSVAARHARAELARDGLLFITDDGSREGVFLNRNGGWIRVHRVSLGVGDRLRLGQLEVPLARLSALFGPASGVRLRRRPAPPVGSDPTPKTTASPESGRRVPRRNPDTGNIEV